jgi:hypothetical protein
MRYRKWFKENDTLRMARSEKAGKANDEERVLDNENLIMKVDTD